MWGCDAACPQAPAIAAAGWAGRPPMRTMRPPLHGGHADAIVENAVDAALAAPTKQLTVAYREKVFGSRVWRLSASIRLAPFLSYTICAISESGFQQVIHLAHILF